MVVGSLGFRRGYSSGWKVGAVDGFGDVEGIGSYFAQHRLECKWECTISESSDPSPSNVMYSFVIS